MLNLAARSRDVENTVCLLHWAEVANCYRKSLVSQEARFQEQLTARDNESNKLRYQMEDLQRDVFIKSSGMDRECEVMLSRVTQLIR
jgi:hypothetical protein